MAKEKMDKISKGFEGLKNLKESMEKKESLDKELLRIKENLDSMKIEDVDGEQSHQKSESEKIGGKAEENILTTESVIPKTGYELATIKKKMELGMVTDVVYENITKTALKEKVTEKEPSDIGEKNPKKETFEQVTKKPKQFRKTKEERIQEVVNKFTNKLTDDVFNNEEMRKFDSQIKEIVLKLEKGEKLTDEQKQKEKQFFDDWDKKASVISENIKHEEERIAEKSTGTKKRVYPPEHTTNVGGRNMAYIPPENLVREIRTKNNTKKQENTPDKNISVDSIVQKIKKGGNLSKEEVEFYDKNLGSVQEKLDTLKSSKIKNVTSSPEPIVSEPKKDEVAPIHIDSIEMPDEGKKEEGSPTRKETELTDDQKNILEEKFTKSGFDQSYFEGTGIEELSFEKRILLVETLEQQLLDKVKRGAKEAFEDEIRKSNKFSRIWKNVRKGYNIAKKEKEVLQKHKDGESLISRDTAQALAETVSSITAPITYKEGSIEISYLPEKNDSSEDDVFAKEFNGAANLFSKIPSEWQFSHNKKEQAQYRQSKLIFDTACSEIIAQAPEEAQGELMEKVQRATGNVTLLQHLMTYPEAGAVLARAGKTKAWQTGIESYYKENASFMALGMASRQAIMGTSIGLVSHSAAFASALAAPITGGIIGGLRAKDRAKKLAFETDQLTRRGEIDTQKKFSEKNMTGAEEIDNVFDYLIQKINTTTDPARQKRFLASLETRTKFIERELANGTIRFGQASKSEGNLEADRIRRYASFTQKLAEAKLTLKTFSEDDVDVQNMRHFVKKVTEKEVGNNSTRKRQIEDEIIKGVLIGASFGAAGWMVRHMLPDVDLGIGEKVGELYRNAKGGVEKFFGEQKNAIEKLQFFSADRTIPKDAPLTDIEIKNIPTEKDNVLRPQHVPIDESTEYEHKVVKSKPKIIRTYENNGATIREYPRADDPQLIENLQNGGKDISPIVSEKEAEKISVIDKTKKISVIGKGVPTTEVTVSSKGFIKTIEELQKTFLKEHPGEELPKSLNGNPMTIARQLGLYSPKNPEESAMIIANKDTTLGINEQGDVVLHDATKQTDTILSSEKKFTGKFLDTENLSVKSTSSITEESVDSDSSHGEDAPTHTEVTKENTMNDITEKKIDAVRFFKANKLTYEQATHFASDDNIAEVREKDPELFKYLEDLRKKSGLPYNGEDDSVVNYVERALKKIDQEGIVAPENIIEEELGEDTEMEDSVSPEEDTETETQQSPEDLLKEDIDTLRPERNMPSPEEVSRMVEARARGDVNGTVDGIFGKRRDMFFDRTVIEGSGARNPEWTKIANMKAYDFFANQNFARASKENQVLMNMFRELHTQTGNTVPQPSDTITVEQYLKKEYETLAQQEYKKTGTLMKK